MSQNDNTAYFSVKAEFLARQKIPRLRVGTIMHTGQDVLYCDGRSIHHQ